MNINLPKRLEDDLRVYCKTNNLKISEYIAKCIEKELAFDKFGDLNSILYGNDNVDNNIKEEKIVVSEIEKNNDNKDIVNIIEQKVIEEIKEDEQQKPVEVVVKTEKTNKRRVRTLNSK